MQRDAPNLILRLPSYCVHLQAVGVAGFGTGEDQSNEAA